MRMWSTLEKSFRSSKPNGEFQKWFLQSHSSVSMNKTLFEVLPMGPKFFCPFIKTGQLDERTEFENLVSKLSGLLSSQTQQLDKRKSLIVNSCYR